MSDQASYRSPGDRRDPGRRFAILGVGLPLALALALVAYFASTSDFGCTVCPGAPSGKVTLDQPITIDGQPLEVDSLELFIKHSERPADANCIYEISLHYQRGPKYDGCSLVIRTAPRNDPQGRLLIDDVAVSRRDGFCPSWTLPSGRYTPHADTPLGTIAATAAVQEAWVKRGKNTVRGTCYVGDLILDLGEVAIGDGESSHTLRADSVTLEVAVSTLGAPAFCPP